MSSGKSMKEQLLALFGKRDAPLREVDARTGASVGPPVQPPSADVRGPERSAGTAKPAKKRTVDMAAVRARLKRPGAARPSPQSEAPVPRVRPPARPVTPLGDQAPAPAPKVRPERPAPWQPPRERVLLVDSFGAAASGRIVGETAAGRVAGMATGTGSIFRRLQERPRIQVGLDFGTSSTKAMWSRLNVPDSEVRAIDFGHELAGVPSYCLPSIAAFDSKGNLALGDTALRLLPEDGVPFALSRFKMLLAGGVDARYLDARNKEMFDEHVRAATGDEGNCTPESLTVVYLAFAMRRVRRRLEAELNRTDLDLSFNTCVPVDQRANSAVFERFDRTTGAAERLERHAKDSESARSWLERAAGALTDGPLSADERRLFLVPEAVAGTAAYVASLRRDSGLHALIDIGAGTTDVSIFNLSLTQREGAISFWYSARSVPYGAGHIEARLRHLMREAGRTGSLAEVRKALGGERDGLADVAETLREELDRIRRRTNDAWAEAYGHNKLQSAWTRERVKVFLAGGGALIPEAREVFSRSWVGWGPYPCHRVPDPESYDSRRAGGPFVRISVAYGLTTPIPVLGRWVMPADSPDHTPPPAPVRQWQQDGDQLIPRPGW